MCSSSLIQALSTLLIETISEPYEETALHTKDTENTVVSYIVSLSQEAPSYWGCVCLGSLWGYNEAPVESFIQWQVKELLASTWSSTAIMDDLVTKTTNNRSLD